MYQRHNGPQAILQGSERKSIGKSRDVECVDTAPTIVSKGGKGILTSSCAVRVRCAIGSRLIYVRKHTAELFITKPAGIVPRT